MTNRDQFPGLNTRKKELRYEIRPGYSRANLRHHGPATQSSHPRGIVAAAGGDGRNVVLVWLFDHRGGYALLVIDAATGESREFPVPFPPGDDCPYASLLSSRNRFYTHFNGLFRGVRRQCDGLHVLPRDRSAHGDGTDRRRHGNHLVFDLSAERARFIRS